MPYVFNPFTGTFDYYSSGSSTPAGSDGEVQFNAAGVFGSDPLYYWDNTNKRLGVQVTTPASPFHAASTIGTTINAPTSLIATRIAEVLGTPPTYSASEIIGPTSDMSGLSSSFSYDGVGPYTADGSNWDVNLYAYYFYNGNYYIGGAINFNVGTDDSSFGLFSLPSSWAVASHGQGYIVEILKNSVVQTQWVIPNLASTSALIDGSEGQTNVAGAFIGNVGFSPFNTATLTDGTLNATVQNTGTGNYTANGQTINYLVYEYRNHPYNGRKYVTSAPYGFTFTDPINDGSTAFSVNIDVTAGDGNGRFLLISYDGGSTYPYGIDMATGTNIDDNGDLTAAPDVSHVLASYTGMQRDYQAYGVGSFPSSYGTYYSATNNPYTVTDSNPASGYIIQHTYISTGNLAIDNILGAYDGHSLSNSLVSAHADFLETTNPNIWSGGSSTVTPIHYGILSNGVDLNLSFKAYSFNVTQGIYSAASTAVTSISDPNNGQYYYYTLALVNSAGNVGRILRNVNGAGYLTGYGTITTTTLTFDAGGAPWSGTTTILPNATYPATGTVEMDVNTVNGTTPPVFKIVSTAASNGTPSLGFYRNSTKIAWIGIGTDTTMFLEASQFSFGSVGSGFSTPGITLASAGSATFNVQQNNAQFKVQGSTNQNTLLVRGNDNFVTMGSVMAANIFAPNPTAYIEPTSTSREGLLLRQPSNATTSSITDMIRLIDVAHPSPNTLFSLNAQGWIGVGRGSPGALIHLAGGTTSVVQMKFTAGANATIPQAGAVEYVNNFSLTNTNNIRFQPGGSIFVNNNSVTNTTTIESTFFLDTVAANTLIRGGDKICYTVSGTTNAHATATFDIRSYFAATKIFDSGALAHVAAVDWTLTVEIMRGSSANTVAYSSIFCANGITPIVQTGTYSPTLSTGQNITCTGQAAGAGAASSQITAYKSSLIFQPSF